MTNGPQAAQVPVSALEAHGLVKRYGRKARALAGIDLVIKPGGLTALVGPNGAGKSTLIKAYVGLEPPSEGRVLVEGIDPWRDRRRALSRVGYVPQTPSLYSGLSMSEHLDYVTSLRPTFDRGLACQRMSDLDIPLHRRAGELSGGQQAQAGLALALGTRASILLLDEPLASLDPLARREFLHVLQDAVAYGDTTALLSSHVVSDIEQACDRVVVLGTGRKLLDATLASAIGSHWISSGPLNGREGLAVHVATFSAADREGLHLWRIDVASRGHHAISDPGFRQATLEEVVLGYLASSRVGQIA